MKRASWLAGLLLLLAAYISLVSIPRQALVVERIPVATSPTDVGLAFEAFRITAEGESLPLAGWWMPAQDAGATLVFIHGGGSNRHNTFFGSLKFYRAIVDAGINVAAIDLRNHGDSGADGIGLQFGRTESADAMAAIRWARERAPDLPLFAMGISMGGATIIHAAHRGAQVDGLVLLDALLDTRDTFKQGGWIETGLPAGLFAPSAWSATTFFGLPTGDEQSLDRAAALALPMLVIQDPDDPVTRARFSRELAQRNPRVTYWMAPPIDPDHPDLAWKGRWGSHVSAFLFFPVETVAQIRAFIAATSRQGKAAWTR